jgi:hypothetical protein
VSTRHAVRSSYPVSIRPRLSPTITSSSVSVVTKVTDRAHDANFRGNGDAA